MNKKLNILITVILVIAFPLICCAEWVDADLVGQESVLAYDNDVEGWPSLAIDSNGYPHIVFRSGTGAMDNGDLYYLKWNGSAWVDADGTGQESALVYPGGGGNAVSIPQLALNSSDQACIAFFYGSALGGGDIYYLQWNGSAWVDADGTGQGDINVSNTGNAGASVSLKLNNSGQPRIAWQDGGTFAGDIYYLQWNGSAWVDADGTGQGDIVVYDGTGDAHEVSLALGSPPHIAWYDDTVGGSHNDIFYLEWYVEPTQDPDDPEETPETLPETGVGFIDYVNQLLL